MLSKKRLFQFIKDRFNRELNLHSKGIGNETYGKQSCIYIWNTLQTLGVPRKTVETIMIQNGFKVNRNYWPGTENVEIRVSYFHGMNWNE